MHTALWKLYRLRIRGGIRSMLAKVKSVRGAVLGLFTLLVVAMMIGPNLAMAVKLGGSGVMGRSADSFRQILPVAMFSYVVLSVLTSLGERAIYFSPSEVDFLFPAPFSRRQLLLYKILGSLTGALFIALLMPTSLVLYIRSWLAAAVGFFLAALALNSLTMCAQLIAQSVGERAFTRARRLLLAGLAVAVAAAAGEAAARGLQGPWQETLLSARHSLPAQILLAPFEVFAAIIAAERLVPDALGWAAVGLAMVGGVYALAIRLDANYLETAVRVSRQIQERKQRALRDGVLAAQPKRLTRSSRLPQFPWLGGVGPLAWRQTVQSLRGGRGAMVLMAIVALAAGAPLAFGVRSNQNVQQILPPVVIGLTAYITFLFSAQAPLGFRGDYERMDLLKTLPIRPIAVACGQTIVVAVLLSLMQGLVFAVAALFVPGAASTLFLASLFAIPFNWLLFGTENILFLLYPSPPVATGSEGFLRMGRVMLFMLAKFLMLTVCGVVAAIPAAAVYWLTKSLLAACLAAWLTAIFPVLVILLLIAWAFGRYDVSAGRSE